MQSLDEAGDVARAYASPPWWYDVRGLFILTFSYRTSLWSQLRFFAPRLGRRHLEVACGTGTLLRLVLLWRRWRGLPGCHVVGVDYSPSMLAGAARRFARAPDVELHQADASKLPFAEATFDTASIANAVHCVVNVHAVLREVHRTLKPGGTLAMNALLFPRGRGPLARLAERINRWGVRRGILHSPFDARDIRQRVEASGFSVIEEVLKGNSLNLLARK